MEAHLLSNERARMVNAALLPLLAVALLWSVHVLDAVYSWQLNTWGNIPRTMAGLPGILLQPFFHADLEHLLNNSLSLLVLGWCLVYFYPRVAGRVAWITWVVSGVAVWLTARPDRHIGASGVVYGLAFFLFFSGVFRRQRALMAISLLVVFLYGGLLWGLLPTLPRISWESHLWGGLTGAGLAWWYRHISPAHLPPPPLEEAVVGAGIAAGVLENDDPGDETTVEDSSVQHAPPYYDPEATDTTWHQEDRT
ncbi:MAG: rhomboid family intramembrane serine protease [Flavobacteriales bacterium]|nr:rhomboid family intramembrane serine protease [Flavobacteriales bacterium]